MAKEYIKFVDVEKGKYIFCVYYNHSDKTHIVMNGDLSGFNFEFGIDINNISKVSDLINDNIDYIKEQIKINRC
jgi:hypothetical protein